MNTTNVSNNAFTNRMVQWHLEKALSVYDWLCKTFPNRAAELEKAKYSKQRSRWQDIVNNLWIPYDQSTGLIEQWGFFNLEDINLADYEPRTRSMQAILGIDGANKRQVLKQPDVLILLYLMRQSHDFPYNEEALRRTGTTHRALTYWLVPRSGDSRDLSLGFRQNGRSYQYLKRHWWIWRMFEAMLLMGFTELLPVECGRQWFWDSAGFN